ncbi:MAG: EamA family transporter [Bacteroidetes bacterium]|nr:EamA family transporter [Bacteroidota bacterium]MCW5896588.1 EamA family transporter [Bacteroidota bacterium]
MKTYILYAVIAGLAWGIGGYFEKSGLRELGLPPIAGIFLRTAVAVILLGLISIPAWKAYTPSSSVNGWLMIIIGGGIVAGSLGMWSFYASLATSENLGVTLAVAFALSPIAGTVIGLVKGTQEIDIKTGLGLLAIVGGIILIQLAHRSPEKIN